MWLLIPTTGSEPYLLRAQAENDRIAGLPPLNAEQRLNAVRDRTIRGVLSYVMWDPMAVPESLEVHVVLANNWAHEASILQCTK